MLLDQSILEKGHNMSVITLDTVPGDKSVILDMKQKLGLIDGTI